MRLAEHSDQAHAGCLFGFGYALEIWEAIAASKNAHLQTEEKRRDAMYAFFRDHLLPWAHAGRREGPPQVEHLRYTVDETGRGQWVPKLVALPRTFKQGLQP